MTDEDKPAIIVLDPDGPEAAVAQELMSRYSKDYLIVSALDAAGALDLLGSPAAAA